MSDNAKYTLVLAKVVLSYLNLWPQTRGWWVKPLRFVIFLNMICLCLVNSAYLLNNTKDIGIMASTSAAFSTSIQTASKIFFLNYYCQDLTDILRVIEKEYWPANFVDEHISDSIRFNSKMIIWMMATYLCSAYFSCWYFNELPLLQGVRTMPLESSFPFEWKQSPTYEILYVWQYITSCLFIVNTLCMFDYFFNALIINQIAQFKLLKGVLKTIGTKKGVDIYRRFTNDYKRTLVSNDINDEEIEYYLVIKCVQHHVLVSRICRELERIYRNIMFIQFFLSCAALCASAFVFSKFPVYFTKMLSFLAAHLIQLYFLCTVGNELIYQSANVSEAVFQSGWYKKPHTKVRKALLFIIQQSHRPQTITAMGLSQLDYLSFINVLRLSFSFYTVLNSLEME